MTQQNFDLKMTGAKNKGNKNSPSTRSSGKGKAESADTEPKVAQGGSTESLGAKHDARSDDIGLSSQKPHFGPERPLGNSNSQVTENVRSNPSRLHGARPLPPSNAEKRQSRSNPLASPEAGRDIKDHNRDEPGSGKRDKKEDGAILGQECILEKYKKDIQLLSDQNKDARAQLEAASLEIYRLQAIEKSFQKLQDEKLNAVDRFKPAFDSDLVGRLEEINNKMMKALVLFLSKANNDRDIIGISKVMEKYLWKSPHFSVDKPFNFNDRDLRKRLLKSMIWRFLQNQLFGSPFLCFGGEAGNVAGTLHSVLYHDACSYPDSAKWRSFTAERLIDSEDEHDDEEVQRRLFINFQLALHELGYKIDDVLLQEKTRPLFQKAIQLAKLFARQRAIYELFDHQGRKWWTKERDSGYCRNQEDDDDPEGEGDIAFVIVPALVRRGTAMGEDLKQAVFLTKALVHLVE
ncbi:hypothetical protein BGZ60DRAFT_513047 [Tricladium varicosporioides]|nr:hypothetical protein BGZ60DRAFT_513047 [Hymenoscyphus varicosporioides]